LNLSSGPAHKPSIYRNQKDTSARSFSLPFKNVRWVLGFSPPKIMVNCAQLNMGKRKDADRELQNFICKHKIDILFLQEPSLTTKNKLKTGKFYTYSLNNCRSRSAIWISNTKQLRNPLLLNNLSDSDTTTMTIDIFKDQEWKTTIVTSIYMPHETRTASSKKYITNPINSLCSEIVNFANNKNMQLLICSDTNSRSLELGDEVTNTRGNYLMEFIKKQKLTVHNTFNTRTRGDSIIDLTLTNNQMVNQVSGWHIQHNFIFSDHKLILFFIKSTDTKQKEFDIKRCNWKKYTRLVEEYISNETWQIENIHELEETSNKLSEIMTKSFELSAKKKSNNTFRLKNKLSKKTKRMKADLIEAYNEAKNSSLEPDKLKYKTLKKEYEKTRKNEETERWKKFTESIESIKDTARLRKIMENKGSKQLLGSIKKNDNSYTASVEETVFTLFNIHFPDCILFTTNPPPNIPPSTGNEDKISKLFSPTAIRNAISEFGKYKSPGPDKIYPIQLQKLPENAILLLQNLFIKSVLFEYIPTPWLEVDVIFLPKPNKKSYDLPKSWRPISLLSFLTKTMEKILNLYVRDTLKEDGKLFDTDQHAYQENKGTDTALLNVTTRIRKALHHKEYLILTSIDFEGAFDNCNHANIENILKNKKIDKSITNWIMFMLKNRKINARDLKNPQSYKPTKGTPQGSVISPLLWNLLIDTLITELKKAGFQVTVYADDVIISLNGKKQFANNIRERMNAGLKIVNTWCTMNGIKTSPDKSNYMEFNKPSNKETRFPEKQITLNERNVPCVDHCKYLGIVIDNKLTWNEHIKYITEKGRKTFWATRSFISNTWGLNPARIKWIYDQVVIPRITYGSIVWWDKCLQSHAATKINRIQNPFIRAIVGSTKLSPVEPIKTLLGISDITDNIINNSVLTFLRLKNNKLWNSGNSTYNQIATRTEELDIPQHLMNNVSRTARPSFNIAVTERPAKENPQSERPGNWFIAMNYHKKGIKTSYCNPFSNISEGNLLSNCKNYAIALKFVLNRIIPQIKNTHNTTLFINKRDILNKIKNQKSELLYEEITKLNKINNIIPLTLKFQSTNNKLMNKLDKWTKDTKTKNPTKCLSTSISAKDFLKKKTITDINKKWNLNNNFPFAKLNLKEHNNRLSNFLLRRPKKEIKGMTSAITGYGLYNKYRKMIGISDNDTCRLCKSEIESPNHIIMQCTKTKPLRDKYINHKRNQYLSKTSPKNILIFLKKSKIMQLLVESTPILTND
jgi:Reverse transcriptase (RNA-dependent DNA polymerase)/Endonuclease-reverse transcriptase